MSIPLPAAGLPAEGRGHPCGSPDFHRQRKSEGPGNPAVVPCLEQEAMVDAKSADH